MCLNFIILCILAITQVLGVPILNTYKQLKNSAHEKCPSLEKSMLLDVEFLKQCDSVDEELFKVPKITTHNIDAALCIMYSSVFEHLCDSIGSNNNYDAESFSNKIEESIKKSNVSSVCSSLGDIPKTVVTQPVIITALHSLVLCNRFCIDFDAQLKKVCSLTSSMWAFSKVLDSQNINGEVKKPQISYDLSAKGKQVYSPSSDYDSYSKNENHSLPTTNVSLSNIEELHSQLPSNRAPIELNSKDNLQQNHNRIVSTDEKVSSDNEVSIPSPAKVQDIVKALMPNVSDNKTSIKTTSKVEDTPVIQIPTAPINKISLKPDVKKDELKKNELEKDELKKDELKNVELKKDELKKDEVDIKKIEQNVNTNIDQPVEPPPEDGSYVEGGDDDFESINDSPLKQTKVKSDAGKINVKDENIYGNDQLPKFSEVKVKPAEVSKPREIDEDTANLAANFQNQNVDDSNSYFFSYFMMVCVLFICGYVAYHNKQKILALVLEGRKGRRSSRTRRPNSANYHKLDTTLEEAVTSSVNKNTTQVIY